VKREKLSERIARERKEARAAAFAEACRALKWDLVAPDAAVALWEWFRAGNTKPVSEPPRADFEAPTYRRYSGFDPLNIEEAA
jgi:hypothetical protein